MFIKQNKNKVSNEIETQKEDVLIETETQKEDVLIETETQKEDASKASQLTQDLKIRRNIESENLILSVKNLRVSFKRKNKLINIVRGVDLEIKKGEIIGLVGESGSGKTVTTKSLLDINRGAVTKADHAVLSDVDLLNLKSFANIRGKKIGYIPQDPMTSLNPTRKIYKQILDVIKIHRKEIATPKERKKYIVDLLERFGIRDAENKMNAYPHSFSGGMKQRVVIAMVVAGRPDLIVADEPTTALDATVQAAVLELFTEIKTKENISIIFISHNISVVAKLCDYIYVMYAGKIVEQAKKETLFKNPQHPYTWALISSLPEDIDKANKLSTIEGTPPNMEFLGTGDPFAPRNKYAMEIDFQQEPPLFHIEDEHYAATWLLHPESPEVFLEADLQEKIDKFKEVFK